MNYLKKYASTLLILQAVIMLAGYAFSRMPGLSLDFNDIFILSLLFLINNGICLYVFYRGQSRDPESQTMHSLVAVSLKFIVELGITFVWFIIAKKTELQSVMLFFVLYLSFTLFSILTILKTLKNKTL